MNIFNTPFKNFMTHFKNVIKDGELRSELEAYLIENGNRK